MRSSKKRKNKSKKRCATRVLIAPGWRPEPKRTAPSEIHVDDIRIRPFVDRTIVAAAALCLRKNLRYSSALGPSKNARTHIAPLCSSHSHAVRAEGFSSRHLITSTNLNPTVVTVFAERGLTPGTASNGQSANQGGLRVVHVRRTCPPFRRNHHSCHNNKGIGHYLHPIATIAPDIRLPFTKESGKHHNRPKSKEKKPFSSAYSNDQVLVLHGISPTDMNNVAMRPTQPRCRSPCANKQTEEVTTKEKPPGSRMAPEGLRRSRLTP